MDEQLVVAGDLTSSAVGKRVRVTYERGVITSTVDDVLQAVRHREVKVSAYPTASKVETELFFRTQKWTSGGLLFAAQEVGLLVDSSTEVTVLS